MFVRVESYAAAPRFPSSQSDIVTWLVLRVALMREDKIWFCGAEKDSDKTFYLCPEASGDVVFPSVPQSSMTWWMRLWRVRTEFAGSGVVEAEGRQLCASVIQREA